jgi:hypothetical protein
VIGMTDFRVVDVPGMLNVRATAVNGRGGEIPDEEWNRHAAASQYVYAEFLSEKGLLESDMPVRRTPDLVIRWSQLTPTGQSFTRAAFHRWMESIDKAGTSEAVMRQKLEKRWRKFGDGQ